MWPYTKQRRGNQLAPVKASWDCTIFPNCSQHSAFATLQAKSHSWVPSGLESEKSLAALLRRNSRLDVPVVEGRRHSPCACGSVRRQHGDLWQQQEWASELQPSWRSPPGTESRVLRGVVAVSEGPQRGNHFVTCEPQRLGLRTHRVYIGLIS